MNICSFGDPSTRVVPLINQYIDNYKTMVPYGLSYDCVTIMIKQSLKKLYPN